MYKLENISKSSFEKENGKIKRGPKAKYPFNQLNIDQSFFVPSEVCGVQSIRVYANNYSKNGKQFSVAKTEDGCRVFRVK